MVPCGHGDATITVNSETATTTERHSPVQIGTDTNWLSGSIGGRHTLALKTDGTLWAWGYNDYGQLGNVASDDRLSPVRIGTNTTWIAISAGEGHNLAIRSNGTLWT